MSAVFYLIAIKSVKAAEANLIGGIWLHGEMPNDYWDWRHDKVYYWLKDPVKCGGSTYVISYKHVNTETTS